jgi:hyperpolarization activated cyclic nucleotide-gated potassium channel 2
VISVVLEERASTFLRASKMLKLLRLSRLTKVFRLLKVTKLGKFLTEVKESIEDRFRIQIPEAALILSRLLISLMVLAHWVGCINFMIVRLYGYPEDSWVVFADLEHAQIDVQYSWCFYRALSLMIQVGYDVPSIVNTSCVSRTPWCTVSRVYYKFLLTGSAYT